MLKMAYNPNIHHRRSIRLKGYDYSQSGLYFITICTQNVGANRIRPIITNRIRPTTIRPHIFGDVINGKMILNEYGQIAHDEWAKTPEVRSNVQLDVFVVMPNHIHGIIVITDSGRGELHSPNAETPNNETNMGNHQGVCDTPQSSNHQGVCDTPQSSNHQGVCDTPENHRGVCDTPLRSPSNAVGAIIRGYKSAVTKRLNQSGFIESIWQRNYYEHIIRNEQSYQNIANYIINNPANWGNDKFYTK